MAKGDKLSKKQKGFDTYGYKRYLKSLTPEQKEILYSIVDSPKNSWLAQYINNTKPSDFWQYVYVVSCQKYYKIGIAGNMSSRLNGLQCGNPYPIKLIFAIKHPKADEIEKILHKKFESKNLKREWFELVESDLVVIQNFIKEYE